MNYKIIPESIQCLRCGKVSYNRDDIARHYCGACKIFHDDPLPENFESEDARLKQTHDHALSECFRMIHEGTRSMEEVRMLTLQIAQSLMDGVRLYHQSRYLAERFTPHDPSRKSPAPGATP